MASADQIRALVQAHYDRNEERFRLTVLQIASHIKDEQRRKQLQALTQNQLLALPVEARGVLQPAPRVEWEDLVLEPALASELQAVSFELQHRTEFVSRGLPARSRLLFHGPPGNGKTSAASALGGLLGLDAYVVSLPNLMESYMGATGAKLDKAFAALRGGHLVVFDEIDCIGQTRGAGDHSGSSREYNTITNTLLTLLDESVSGTLVATTNRVDMLDPALRRRFDVQLEFRSPTVELALRLVHQLCARYQLSADWFAAEVPKLLSELGDPPPAEPSYDLFTKLVLDAARAQVRTEIRARAESGKGN